MIIFEKEKRAKRKKYIFRNEMKNLTGEVERMKKRKMTR